MIVLSGRIFLCCLGREEDNMKKRILAMICSIAMCFMLVAPVTADAQTSKIIGSAGEDCYYVFYPDTGLMKILPCSWANEDANIYHYIEVGEEVKNLVIAEGISGIDGNVFAGWNNLESVQMPDSVTYISYGAFMNCTSLKGGLVIPKNVTEIRAYAFEDCTSMDKVTFEGSAPEYIGEEAFWNVTADVYYDGNDSSWDNMKNNYGGNLTWAEKPVQKVDTWMKDGIGWWYQNADGSYPANQWKFINNEWYFFDASGYMKTGWLNQGGTWYYLTSGGAMKTGWLNDGGTWYYMESSGAMKTGWLNDGGTWYYMASSGVMQTGWINLGGTWYYLASSGAMASNQWIGNYYVLASGAMATNQWVGIYYVGANGAWIPGYR